MPLIERYVFRRAAQAFLLTLGALVGTLWVTQVLRDLDVVTAKGQAIWIFLVMTILALPALVQIVAPIAFLIGTVVTLSSLNGDSELPVISSAGGSRKAVHRPVLILALLVTFLVALSHHVLAPASLSTLHALMTRVRADVIATLVKDGGFRSVDEGLTMHIREKMPDGSFQDIFVSDDRDPNISQQYSASRGVLLEHAGGSFLVLQRGDLIRDDRLNDERNIVAFDTYALDLSDLGAPNAAALFRAKERSTFYLAGPTANDEYAKKYPERVRAEIHDRVTAPLYTLVFALICLAFLGTPKTSRQERGFSVAAAVLFCVAFQVAGFAASSLATGSTAALALLYVIPLAGIAFGLYACTRDTRRWLPRSTEALLDSGVATVRRLVRRFLPRANLAGADGA
jgi:lipopolysaccharide export system permease protein